VGPKLNIKTGPGRIVKINLIRQMSMANPLWGAPRIHGELLMLARDSVGRRFGGIDVLEFSPMPFTEMPRYTAAATRVPSGEGRGYSFLEIRRSSA